MGKSVVVISIAYAGIGLVASAIANLMALAGLRPGGTGLFIALSLGIFPLGASVAFFYKLIRPSESSIFHLVNDACPLWLRILTFGVWAYGFATFAFVSGLQPNGRFSEVPILTWRSFSGVWMIFYCTGLMVVTTAYLKISGQTR